MRKILSILLLSICGICVFGQSLEFSQVLLVNSTTDTVPVGKVWKITSILPTEVYTFGSNNSPLVYVINVNGNQRKIGNAAWTDSNQNAVASVSVLMPIWLPAGTTLQAGSNIGEISIIEFTVIP